jgi:pyruvate kinase
VRNAVQAGAGSAAEAMRRRAKIVCTLGPATADVAAVLALAGAGMDVARLNFSHGTHEEHARSCVAVRSAASSTGRAIAVLADLQGPKIRLGTFAAGPVHWSSGDEVVITVDNVPGSSSRVSTNFEGLPATVEPGDRLLVDDGNLSLVVAATSARDVRCRVVEGGDVSDHKGLSLPGLAVEVPAFTAKDEHDLRFALGIGVDLVALSFVQQGSDVDPVRGVIAEAGSAASVIAKIEKPRAVGCLAEIVDRFDGIMVARGDLGVEIPLEQVPLVQKRAVGLGRQAGKPTIVATQMLESMITNPRPTRAEVSDVATAVFDGADAMMLSAETSVGAHAEAAVRTMGRIIGAAEVEASGHAPPISPALDRSGAALVEAAVATAMHLGACALVAFTQTGATARRIARHRPPIPILAFTPVADVRQQLALSWGVETFIVPTVATTDEMVVQVQHALLGSGKARAGDQVVIVAGTPPGVAGTTNTVRVERIGEQR